MHNMAGAVAAVGSGDCRLNTISLQACGVDRRTAEDEGEGWLRRIVGGLIGGCQSRLIAIDLTATKIGDADCEQLAKGLAQCALLKEVNFGGNQIGDAGVAQLAEALPRCKALAAVDLSGNQIGDAGVVQLAEALPRCKALAAVDLSGNQIGDAGAVQLAEGITQCKTLAKVSVGGNTQIGAVGYEALLATNREGLVIVADYPRLGLGTADTEWRLYNKGVTDQDCAALAMLMPRCPRLEVIDLQSNGITDTGALLLAAALPKCVSLRQFYIWDNRIGTAGQAALAKVKQGGTFGDFYYGDQY